jgi:STAS-like domain of unknown function (DUF4325)
MLNSNKQHNLAQISGKIGYLERSTYEYFPIKQRKTMRYNIHDITGYYAISPSKGEKLHAQIAPLLIAGQDVELDFKGVEVSMAAFFNVAVGSLLKDVSIDNLKRQLKITNLNDAGQKILERVIENSNRYYTEPSYRNAVDTVMEEYIANC